MNTNDLLKSLVRDVAQAKDRLAAARANRKAISADVRAAKRIAGKDEYVRMYLSGYDAPHLSASMTIEVTSLKYDAKLLTLLSRACEFAEATGSRDYTADWVAERTFEFALPSGGRMNIEARLKGEGNAMCRKVITGTRLVEEHTYSIECAD